MISAKMLAPSPAVRQEVVDIFGDVFQHDGPITWNTSPLDIPRWDSLQHLALIRAIEATYSISLSMDEMAEIRSAGDVEAVLSRYGM